MTSRGSGRGSRDVEVGGFLQARGIPEESRGKQTKITIDFFLPCDFNGRSDYLRVQSLSKRFVLGFEN